MESGIDGEPATPSLRERVLAKSQREYATVSFPPACDLPPIRVRSLTAREQMAVNDSLPENAENLETMAGYIAACCLADELDTPLFSPSDRAAIIALDPRVLASLSAAVRELCGLDIGVKQAAKN